MLTVFERMSGEEGGVGVRACPESQFLVYDEIEIETSVALCAGGSLSGFKGSPV